MGPKGLKDSDSPRSTMSTTVTGNTSVACGRTFLNPKSLVISHVLSVTFTNLTTEVWVPRFAAVKFDSPVFYYTLSGSQNGLSDFLQKSQRTIQTFTGSSKFT